jgi:Kef-type K+ transport system membrane component KefB
MIRDSFSEHIIFSVGLLLIAGYIFGQMCERIKLPAITGYLISGIIVGHAGMDLIHAENSEVLHVLSEVTLSFIAVVIGGEFSFAKLKIYGKNVILLTLAQMITTFGLISGGLLIIGMPSYVSFLLGAIGAATAPAATVVIVEKMKARGKFVDYLYGIVALDDAGTIVLFSITFALSAGMISAVEVSILHSISHAMFEIIFSIMIGVFSGVIIHAVTIKKNNKNSIKIITLGILFMATSIAISLHLSPLITNMTIGMLLINLSRKNLRILSIIEPLTPPLYAVFFAIAGTELDPKIFSNKTILIAGGIYIFARAIGKYSGIYLGGKLLKAPENVTNYLGLSLFPQAGVAIGLVLFIQASPLVEAASPEVKEYIIQMINIVLMSVFINELTGPPIAKWALIKGLNRRA